MKKEANSFQALVDRSSEASDTRGFVSLSTLANKAQALLLFLAMMSEKKDCISHFQIINAKSLFIDDIMNLESCFSPPAFSFLTLSFFYSDQHGISPWRSFLT